MSHGTTLWSLERPAGKDGWRVWAQQFDIINNTGAALRCCTI